jgi:hypothetical protein
MEIKNNFESIITLGSFNPAILTPEFLKENGIATFKTPPEGNASPIVSQLKFENITFFVELERFQILDNKIASFDKSPIVAWAFKYLDILKYTPVFVQGVNFNVNLTDFEENKNIQNIFKDPIREMPNYVDKVNEYWVDVKTEIAEGEAQNQVINCKYDIGNEISISTNLNRKDKEILLNFNYEVQNIKSERKRLNIIIDNYQSIYEKFNLFINRVAR